MRSNRAHGYGKEARAMAGSQGQRQSVADPEYTLQLYCSIKIYGTSRDSLNLCPQNSPVDAQKACSSCAANEKQ